MPTTAARHLAAIMLLCLARPTSAHASEIAVRYLVERTPLVAALATATVTIELHTDASCNAPIASETFPLRDLQPVLDLKRVKLRGVRPAARVVELRHVASGVPAVSSLYARVRGDDIVPAGDACQVQAFVPPAVLRPIVRDANGTSIGALALMSSLYTNNDAQTAVLRDDGHGVYGLAIGSMIFATFESGSFVFPTTDCSGPPYLPRPSPLEPTTVLYESGVFYGPGGPPELLSVASASVEYSGCYDETPPESRLTVPMIPLDLARFVPPFRIDHAPTP
ncbi:MAG: hypothetical protein ABIR79_11640 [Candidatus Binatia bacterium]